MINMPELNTRLLRSVLSSRLVERAMRWVQSSTRHIRFPQPKDTNFSCSTDTDFLQSKDFLLAFLLVLIFAFTACSSSNAENATTSSVEPHEGAYPAATDTLSGQISSGSTSSDASTYPTTSADSTGIGSPTLISETPEGDSSGDVSALYETDSIANDLPSAQAIFSQTGADMLESLANKRLVDVLVSWVSASGAALRVPVAAPCTLINNGYSAKRDPIPLPRNSWALTAADSAIEAADILEVLERIATDSLWDVDEHKKFVLEQIEHAHPEEPDTFSGFEEKLLSAEENHKFYRYEDIAVDYRQAVIDAVRAGKTRSPDSRATLLISKYSHEERPTIMWEDTSEDDVSKPVGSKPVLFYPGAEQAGRIREDEKGRGDSRVVREREETAELPSTGPTEPEESSEYDTHRKELIKDPHIPATPYEFYLYNVLDLLAHQAKQAYDRAEKAARSSLAVVKRLHDEIGTRVDGDGIPGYGTEVVKRLHDEIGTRGGDEETGAGRYLTGTGQSEFEAAYEIARKAEEAFNQAVTTKSVKTVDIAPDSEDEPPVRRVHDTYDKFQEANDATMAASQQAVKVALVAEQSEETLRHVVRKLGRYIIEDYDQTNRPAYPPTMFINTGQVIWIGFFPVPILIPSPYSEFVRKPTWEAKWGNHIRRLAKYIYTNAYKTSENAYKAAQEGSIDAINQAQKAFDKSIETGGYKDADERQQGYTGMEEAYRGYLKAQKDGKYFEEAAEQTDSIVKTLVDTYPFGTPDSSINENYRSAMIAATGTRAVEDTLAAFENAMEAAVVSTKISFLAAVLAAQKASRTSITAASTALVVAEDYLETQFYPPPPEEGGGGSGTDPAFIGPPPPGGGTGGEDDYAYTLTRFYDKGAGVKEDEENVKVSGKDTKEYEILKKMYDLSLKTAEEHFNAERRYFITNKKANGGKGFDYSGLTGWDEDKEYDSKGYQYQKPWLLLPFMIAKGTPDEEWNFWRRRGYQGAYKFAPDYPDDTKEEQKDGGQQTGSAAEGTIHERSSPSLFTGDDSKIAPDYVRSQVLKQDLFLAGERIVYSAGSSVAANMLLNWLVNAKNPTIGDYGFSVDKLKSLPTDIQEHAIITEAVTKLGDHFKKKKESSEEDKGGQQGGGGDGYRGQGKKRYENLEIGGFEDDGIGVKLTQFFSKDELTPQDQVGEDRELSEILETTLEDANLPKDDRSPLNLQGYGLENEDSEYQIIKDVGLVTEGWTTGKSELLDLYGQYTGSSLKPRQELGKAVKQAYTRSKADEGERAPFGVVSQVAKAVASNTDMLRYANGADGGIDRRHYKLFNAHYMADQCHNAVAARWLWDTVSSILSAAHPHCLTRLYGENIEEVLNPLLNNEWKKNNAVANATADDVIAEIYKQGDADNDEENDKKFNEKLLDKIFHSEIYRVLDLCNDAFRVDAVSGRNIAKAVKAAKAAKAAKATSGDKAPFPYAYDMCSSFRLIYESPDCDTLYTSVDPDVMHVKELLFQPGKNSVTGLWRVPRAGSAGLGAQGINALALAIAAGHHIDQNHDDASKYMNISVIPATPTLHWMKPCSDDRSYSNMFNSAPSEFLHLPKDIRAYNPTTDENEEGLLSLPLPYERLGSATTVWVPGGCNLEQWEATHLTPQFGWLLYILGATTFEAQNAIGIAVDMGIVRGLSGNETNNVKPASSAFKNALLPLAHRTPLPFIPGSCDISAEGGTDGSSDGKEQARAYLQNRSLHNIQNINISFAIEAMEGYQPDRCLNTLADLVDKAGLKLPEGVSSNDFLKDSLHTKKPENNGEACLTEATTVAFEKVKAALEQKQASEDEAQRISVPETLATTTADHIDQALSEVEPEVAEKLAGCFSGVHSHLAHDVKEFIMDQMLSLRYGFQSGIQNLENEGIVGNLVERTKEYLDKPITLEDNGRTLPYQLGLANLAVKNCLILQALLPATISNQFVFGGDCNFNHITMYHDRLSDTPYKNPDLLFQLQQLFTAYGNATEKDDTCKLYIDKLKAAQKEYGELFNPWEWECGNGTFYTPEQLAGGKWMSLPMPCHWLWALMHDCNPNIQTDRALLSLFGYADRSQPTVGADWQQPWYVNPFCGDFDTGVKESVYSRCSDSDR